MNRDEQRRLNREKYPAAAALIDTLRKHWPDLTV